MEKRREREEKRRDRSYKQMKTNFHEGSETCCFDPMLMHPAI